MAKGKVVYIDSNYVKEIYQKYVNVYNDINREKNASSIALHGEIKSIYDKQKGDFNKKQVESDVLKSIKAIRNKISQTMYALKTIDSSVDIRGYKEKKNVKSKEYQNSYKDIRGRTKKMTLFQMRRYARLNNGTSFMRNGKWYIRIGNYTYNYNDGVLTDNKRKKNIKVNYYVPSNYRNLAKMNTVTVLECRKKSNDFNAIVINITGWKRNNNEKDVEAATKFMNSLAKTDRKHTENIIMGGSVWGSNSLHVAAECPKTYDTIICVNNAAVVRGQNIFINGKNQMSLAKLKKLNGKKIYFVSTKNDDNMYHYNQGGKDFAKCSDVTQSYLYTGLKIVCKYCPDSEVHMITNSSSSVFRTITYGNYHYNKQEWNNLNLGDYDTHQKYGYVIKNVIDSPLVSSKG